MGVRCGFLTRCIFSTYASFIYENCPSEIPSGTRVYEDHDKELWGCGLIGVRLNASEEVSFPVPQDAVKWEE